jgi:hypothetical protein
VRRRVSNLARSHFLIQPQDKLWSRKGQFAPTPDDIFMRELTRPNLHGSSKKTV